MTTTPTDDGSAYLGPNPGLSRLYNNVMAVVPAVQLPLVKMELWNTIEAFCIQSTYFRQTIDWIMAPGITEFDFNPVDGTWLVEAILGQTGLSDWSVRPPGVLIDNSVDTPTGQRTGTALCALRPLSFDVTFPDELFSTWFEALLDGVKSRLFAQPVKPWSSLPLAQAHGRKFQARVTDARDRADRQWGTRPAAWLFPYYAVGRRRGGTTAV